MHQINGHNFLEITVVTKWLIKPFSSSSSKYHHRQSNRKKDKIYVYESRRKGKADPHLDLECWNKTNLWMIWDMREQVACQLSVEMPWKGRYIILEWDICWLPTRSNGYKIERIQIPCLDQLGVTHCFVLILYLKDGVVFLNSISSYVTPWLPCLDQIGDPDSKWDTWDIFAK